MLVLMQTGSSVEKFSRMNEIRTFKKCNIKNTETTLIYDFYFDPIVRDFVRKPSDYMVLYHPAGHTKCTPNEIDLTNI